MNTNQFILDYLERNESLFSEDLKNNHSQLSQDILGKNLMVIGGAGTIGSSFIKAALKFKPAKLVVVDINENGLTELVRDLRSVEGQFVPDDFVTYPLSFDSPAFRKLFIAHGPFDIVANFAAHKHVRSEKDIYSIEALIENNLVKAKGLLDLLVEYPPKHFFCVSTDKAANPVNIMGASKKMMEELILSYGDKLKVSTARFANVAFSNGSLLEGFLKRIEKEQPLSCPSDVKRFFVSPQESGEICLMACVLGENREIFFPKLDMEKDLIKFADIFPVLLKKLGYEAVIFQSDNEARKNIHLIKEGKYPVYVFKTDTSGEKLYEEFYTEDEDFNLDKYKALGVISKSPIYKSEVFNEIFEELYELLARPNLEKAEIVSWLNKYIPEFEHIETGLGLDKKM
ncbi:UDP-N-acetylglucosamine 4,6-dehydratase [Belliella kenyensis]|uniref:UDP-N-acetylglucosamine 4,6-dehydratase n=1 Tax=Belliella kenyensis TaxID=1472724 RepID=A0ABV8EH40_9BACT|nr:UDP-N-acetylglucosamine 4,6-dehydratase [Belliella kenyensis]MCH7401716.1 UDP-N-acetylglucosamine 4,6-dehydratase [Belliella kenyensis]MDN3604216.1 UDP-N-acetylglucosamine 4,6-dehydratase [Belliella kenyensis]